MTYRCRIMKVHTLLLLTFYFLIIHEYFGEICFFTFEKVKTKFKKTQHFWYLVIYNLFAEEIEFGEASEFM